MMLYEDPRIARFNSKLKKIRMIRGFTQESLSELSNVNIKSIAAYEQNPEKILTASSITLYKLANALNCEMEDLIDNQLIDKEEK